MRSVFSKKDMDTHSWRKHISLFVILCLHFASTHPHKLPRKSPFIHLFKVLVRLIIQILKQKTNSLLFPYVWDVGALAAFMFRGQVKSSKCSSQPLVSHTMGSFLSFPFFYCIIHSSCLPVFPIILGILDTIQSVASGKDWTAAGLHSLSKIMEQYFPLEERERNWH